MKGWSLLNYVQNIMKSYVLLDKILNEIGNSSNFC